MEEKKHVKDSSSLKGRFLSGTNTMKKLFKFLKEVKVEAKRINWPSTKESATVCVVVMIVVVLASIFFLACDYISHKVINFLISF